MKDELKYDIGMVYDATVSTCRKYTMLYIATDKKNELIKELKNNMLGLGLQQQKQYRKQLISINKTLLAILGVE